MRSNAPSRPQSTAPSATAFNRPTTLACQFLEFEAPGAAAPSTANLRDTFVIGYLDELDIPITLRQAVVKIFEDFADPETPYDSLVAENIEDHMLALGENSREPDQATAELLRHLVANAKAKGIHEIQLRRIPRSPRRPL